MNAAIGAGSLPARMRRAAVVLAEAERRLGTPWYFTVDAVHDIAKRFEDEDIAHAERVNQSRELVEAIAEAVYGKPAGSLFQATRDELRQAALKLIDAGWTKQVSDA